MRGGAHGARALSIALLVVGIATYSAWVLEFWLRTGVSATDDPVTALDSPLFRVTRLISGGAFLLASPLLLRVAPLHWRARTTVVAIASLGVVLLLEAARPGSAVVALVTNVAFVLGGGSLVVWWPPRWRAAAATLFVLGACTWAAYVLMCGFGPGHFAGVASRAQMVVRAAQLALGTAYLFQPEFGRRW